MTGAIARLIRSGLFGLMFLPAATSAQTVDVDALISSIDARAVQYRSLTEILQGPDAARALAAFDVMLETKNETMREAAVSAAMTATDERIRARALWETLRQKDSVTIAISADGLNEEARAALDGWIGAQSTWPITARIPETRCLNLNGAGACADRYHLSVSGLKVDMIYYNSVTGSFAMNPEGVLIGEVMNPSSKAVYPATIRLR